jgi:predicted secreted protein
VGAALFLAAGCSGAESNSTSSTTVTVAPGDATTLVTVAVHSDPAAPITVALGQQFAIVLEADPGSGFSWQAEAPPDPKVVLSMGTEFRAPGQAVAGVPGTATSQVLRYGGRGLGNTQIALRYGRPGAAPAADDKRETFSVTVTQTGEPPPTTSPPPTDSTTTTAPVVTAAPRTTTTTRPRTTPTTSARTTTTT